MSEYRATGPGAEGEESPEEIQADIAQTRDEMSSTIDAIQAKLNPDVIKAQVQDAVQQHVEEVKTQVQETITEHVEQVKSHVHDATVGRVENMVSNVSDGMRGSGNGVIDMIKANPVPTALIGLGVGWLLANRQSGGTHNSPARTYGAERTYRNDRAYRTTTYGEGRYGANGYGENSPSVTDRLGDTASSAKDRVADLADTTGDRVGALKDQAGDTVSNLRDQAGDRVNALSDRAQDSAGQVKSSFQQTLDQNPLSIGALAVTLGLAAGLALPGTPVEDRVFGDSRDNLVGQVQAKAQDTMQKVQQVAQDVQQSATETAKQSAQKQGLATAQ